jgi:DNA invertase Pin-like site-specific DNA recombinase/DNA-binding transcriptional regulator YiaG
MNYDTHQKVSSAHLKRDAYLYVRQSTLRQVFENQESTRRQYALKQQGVALGWAPDRVVVIDSDLGESGADKDREGFQRLVTAVSLGQAGIVLGLEVSRLARNSIDWHRLLEICALSNTLILDEDGIYDPAQFNDRLLLGLKGTMSEAELHVLRARLQGGILNKAQRGELWVRPPIGLVYDDEDHLVIDPDRQIELALRTLFETFRRTGSAMATVKTFRQQGILFPRHLHCGPNRGDVLWGQLQHSQVLRVLHNPRYAGAFVFGRSRTRKTVDGDPILERVPVDQWHTFLPGAHAGYIGWEEYEQNQKRLLENAQAVGGDRRRSPAREGPALLQGMIVCGRCGRRMTVRYHFRYGRLCPDYLCQRRGIENGEPICQQIPGLQVDEAVSNLLIELLNPVTLEVALMVQEELQARLKEADRLRKQQVERARYEAELAQRRFLRVDPDHRLVADSLEAEWNHKLRALTEAQEAYERQREQDSKIFTEEQRAAILQLATDFPRLWRDPNTPDRERKRMLRLVLEDVTLLRGEQITLHVRLRGGADKTLVLPLPQTSWQNWTTSSPVLAAIDELLNHHTYREVAAILNERGLRSGKGRTFTGRYISRIQRNHSLKTRYDRLRETGMLTAQEMAQALGVATTTIKIWRVHGLLRGHAYNDKGDYLYDPPGEHAPKKAQGLKLSRRSLNDQILPGRTKEVQYEA